MEYVRDMVVTIDGVEYLVPNADVYIEGPFGNGMFINLEETLCQHLVEKGVQE